MFNNNSNKNLSIYENQLATIFSLIQQYERKREEYILCGDFNGDIHRNSNKFDKNLSKFTENNNLKSTEGTIANTKSFTFSNSVFNSWIDYIMLKCNSTLRHNDSKIIYNIENTSDHNAISTKVYIKKSNSNATQNNNANKEELPRHHKKYKLNWSSEITSNTTRKNQKWWSKELEKMKKSIKESR